MARGFRTGFRSGDTEGKPRQRGGMTTMGNALADFLRQSGLAAKLRDAAVYEAWAAAVGEELARLARPVDFRRGELVVEVASASRRAELAGFTGERYRRLANRRLQQSGAGAQRIRKVSFKPTQ